MSHFFLLTDVRTRVDHQPVIIAVLARMYFSCIWEHIQIGWVTRDMKSRVQKEVTPDWMPDMSMLCRARVAGEWYCILVKYI